MADHKDEKHLNDPAPAQPKNLPDKTVPAKETKTNTPNQETSTMEVHKHPHHITHKKKWFEYLLEFVMLFLAVFLGFVAENIREHRVERQRGIQYVKSFCEDLKQDSAELANMIVGYKYKIEKLNVISSCYDSLSKKLPCNSCLKDLFLNSQSFWEFNNADRTLEQLKNAGGLRLLSTRDADSVTIYDYLVKGHKLDEKTVFQETQTILRNISNELYDYTSIKNNKFTESGLSNPLNKALLNKYFNTLDLYHQYCKKGLGELEGIKSKAVSLRSYFLKKY